jgi:hypothetical protein
MASSVSSEHPFSQGGITISKHCNRPKGDIVKALQCVKCSLCHNLLFRELGPSSLGEDEFDADTDADGEATENAQDDLEEEDSWDILLLEEYDESEPEDDMDYDTY